MRRIPALDALRGIAVSMVIVVHATRVYGQTPWRAVALEVPRFGWAGVDLFFVLSGFLITGILVRTREAPDYFRAFYARRARRILPLYIVAVLYLVFFAPPFLSASAHADRWLLATFTENVWAWRAKDVGTSAQHFWSLAIEEQFYLFWPLVVWWTPRRLLARACAAIVVTALLLRTVAVLAGVDPWTVYMLTPFRMDALAVGAWVAAVGPAVALRWRRPAAWLGGALVLAGFLDGFASLMSPTMQIAGFTGTALLAGALVTVAAYTPAPWLTRRVALQRLGLIAYGVYVVHLPIIEAWRHYGYSAEAMYARWHSLPVALGMAYLTAFATSIPLAALSWRYWERRWLLRGSQGRTSGRSRYGPPAGRVAWSPGRTPET